jgi:hypothetical protein
MGRSAVVGFVAPANYRALLWSALAAWVTTRGVGGCGFLIDESEDEVEFSVGVGGACERAC